MLEEWALKIQSFVALVSWAACICGPLCFAHSATVLRLMLSHLCADFPNGGSRSIFRRSWDLPILHQNRRPFHSPVRTQRDALCPRLHLPSTHFKTAYGGSSWQLLHRFRYLLALKVAVHMWQRCAYDVTLQKALGPRAGHFAGNDVNITGEWATEVVVGWPILQKSYFYWLLFLFAGGRITWCVRCVIC
jgi:hypothetical protein